MQIRTQLRNNALVSSLTHPERIGQAPEPLLCGCPPYECRMWKAPKAKDHVTASNGVHSKHSRIRFKQRSRHHGRKTGQSKGGQGK